MSQVVDVLEYLGESVFVLNNGGPLGVQQGGADQQVEVLARLLGPQHLPEQGRNEKKTMNFIPTRTYRIFVL
jgi:hypothetical protein